jgi:hypothetical protein
MGGLRKSSILMISIAQGSDSVTNIQDLPKRYEKNAPQTARNTYANIIDEHLVQTDRSQGALDDVRYGRRGHNCVKRGRYI